MEKNKDASVDMLDPHVAFVDILHDACLDDGMPLSRLYNYLQDVIMCMPGNVYWMDADCQTVGCNRNVLDMFGMEKIEEFRGLSFDQMAKIGGWTQQQGASFERDTREVLEIGISKPNVEEPPIPGVDGEPIYFLTTRVPLRDKNGVVVGVVGISIDITERKLHEKKLLAAKEEAERANVAKDQFIMNMEHDFRTPFNGICGLASLLYEGEKDPEKKEMLRMIMSSGKELLDYCSSIVDFSRIEKGVLPIYEKKFDVRELFDRVIETELPAAVHRGLKLRSSVASDVPKVLCGDDFRLGRILINLVSNALKFTAKGGVDLSAKCVSQGAGSRPRDILLCICVKDTGLGIREEQKAFIFEKFTRLSESGRSNTRGLGLGLRIVKQFVAEMGGEIEVTSQPNEGSVFSCVFPFKLPLYEKFVG